MRAGVPVVPGTDDAARRRRARTRRSRAVASDDRLSAAGEGGRRRRRQGHADGRPIPPSSPARCARARSEAGAAFGDAAVYLERRLIAAAPHRGAAARRRARHGAAVRRARVLDSAPASEGRRGDAVARRHARAAPGDDVGGGGGRARGRLHQRRHDRVPARRGRPVLLPRDEHAAAGRASDHRDGDRRRSGAVADPHRARRAARPRSGAAAARRTATRSSAASTPRIRTTTSCRRRAGSCSCAAPAGPGIRDDSGATAGLDVPIFYDPLISKLVAWAEDRPAAIARMRRALGEYVVAGIRTTVPFFTWLLAQPEFVAGRFHTTYLDEVLRRATAGRSSKLTRRPRTWRRSPPRCGAVLSPRHAAAPRAGNGARRCGQPIAAGRRRRGAEGLR